MSTLKIPVQWKCEKCDFSIVHLHEYGSELYPPDGITHCGDEAGDHLFCERHDREWMREVEARTPGLVWRA